MRRWALVAALLIGSGPLPAAPSLLAGGDPDALYDGDRLWVYPTGDGKSLHAWTRDANGRWRRGRALLRLRDIAWVRADGARVHHLWAPDMVHDGGRWLLFFSVGPQNPTPSRIGIALCDGPAGPCRDSGRPLVTGDAGFEAIDPDVFTDPATGTHYLYAGGSAGRRLRAWLLTPGMTALAAEVPLPQPELFTEGVFVHERAGTYYLSWSEGRWNTGGYRVRYATANSPVGPWQLRGTLLASDSAFKGPGHHSVVRAPDGRDWIAYHRWEGVRGDGPYRGRRRVALQPLAYAADGTIVPIVMDARAPPPPGR